MLDHALALTFAVGFPAIATPLYARRRAALEAGDPRAKRREYWETIAWLAGMGVATLAVWHLLDRPLVSLGLGFSASWPALLSLGVAASCCALLYVQVRGVQRDEPTREAARNVLEPVREYLPATGEQLRLFRGVSFSAGIGEEIFYRGFLLWYLSQFFPLIVAVIASSVLFGLAHVMHGAQATVRATLSGFVFAGLYLLGGSLIPPMLLHTAIDLSSGEMGRAAFGFAHDTSS